MGMFAVFSDITLFFLDPFNFFNFFLVGEKGGEACDCGNVLTYMYGSEGSSTSPGGLR